MNYIGIDPGVNGGIAVLNEDGSVFCFKTMPKREPEVWSFIHKLPTPSFAVIEWVVPNIFGAAKSSVCKLYGSYTSLRMALVAADISFCPIHPKKWQAAYGMHKKSGERDSRWKRRLMRKAMSLFPRIQPSRATADALLLAHYCKYGGPHADCHKKDS